MEGGTEGRILGKKKRKEVKTSTAGYIRCDYFVSQFSSFKNNMGLTEGLSDGRKQPLIGMRSHI